MTATATDLTEDLRVHRDQLYDRLAEVEREAKTILTEAQRVDEALRALNPEEPPAPARWRNPTPSPGRPLGADAWKACETYLKEHGRTRGKDLIDHLVESGAMKRSGASSRILEWYRGGHLVRDEVTRREVYYSLPAE